MIVNYITRKKQKNYNSIEEIFLSIRAEIAKFNETIVTELKYSGATPWPIFKNLISFKREKTTLNHITGDVHYMALATGKHSILTIHDIGSALSGHFLKQLYIKLFWFWLPAVFVKRITVISEFTKNQLIKIIPFAAHKIKVIPNPVSALISHQPKHFNDDKPVILLMGCKPNKNLERIFEALKNLSCELLIVGNLNPIQIVLLQKYQLNFINKKHLTFKEVIQCYKVSDIVCFPSTYEGFGMPIIEAQAIGRPVVTSHFGAMAEVAGDGACLIDPFDVNSIKKGIEKILTNQPYREDLIQKGLDNCKRFSLESIAQQYHDLYTEISS